ncbi:hypothetical protein RGE_37190 [Rubrivivax gelatinosus IL144]|uniref:DUF4279 domain-containing protein n=2 Tax=Rubrivivax gelatinosus TaxID=28068 RepID=I0HVM1_RUBGI|nr:hypothetical protein RGE_37190 [Rubrivivax gelatinosus IL144]
MASVARSRLSIRFFGEELVPAELTAMLGATPTTQYRKGDERTSASGKVYARKYGAWIIATGNMTPEAIDDQLAELFCQLTQDLSVWSLLTTRYDADVFCGLFMEESNEGFSLKLSTLLALASRGLEIGFDIYDPCDEEDGHSPTPQGEI